MQKPDRGHFWPNPHGTDRNPEVENTLEGVNTKFRRVVTWGRKRSMAPGKAGRVCSGILEVYLFKLRRAARMFMIWFFESFCKSD